MATMLFLLNRYCPESTYNRHFDLWLGWYARKVKNKQFQISFAIDKTQSKKYQNLQRMYNEDKEYQKEVFEEMASPQPLFVMNLVAIRLKRKGVSLKEIQDRVNRLVNKEMKVPWYPRLKNSELKKWSGVDEAVITYPEFFSSGALENATPDEAVRIMKEARSWLEPPKVTDQFGKTIASGIEKLAIQTANWLELIEKLEPGKLRHGVVLKGVGSNGRVWFHRLWPATKPPTKLQIKQELLKLEGKLVQEYQKADDSFRGDALKRQLKECHQWVNGQAFSKKKNWNQSWPVGPKKLGLRIEFQAKGTVFPK